MRVTRVASMAVAAVVVAAGVSHVMITTAFAADNAVIRANAAAGVAATKACIAPIGNPFHESRAYAMMHLAIHDALNAIDRKYQPYAYDRKAEPGTSADAAVAAAAYYVMYSDHPETTCGSPPKRGMCGEWHCGCPSRLCVGFGGHPRWSSEDPGDCSGNRYGGGSPCEASE